MTLEDKKSSEAHLDYIYERLENTLLTKTEEINKTKTINLTLDEPEVMDFFIHNSEGCIIKATQKLKNLIEKYNIPLDFNDIIIAIDSNYLPLTKSRLLKHKSLYKAVSLEAVLVGQDEAMVHMEKAVYYCTSCLRKESQDTDDGIPNKVMCVNCKIQMVVSNENSMWSDVQTLVLREPFEESGDKLPIEHLARIKNELIHKFHIGQKLKIIGVKKVPHKIKFRDQKTEIVVLFAESTDDKKEQMPTEDEIKLFKKQSKEPDFEQKIISSFAPDVFCTIGSTIWDVKASILLFLVGSKEIERKRQSIHMLLVGDPGTAKTTMMKAAASLAPRSIYVTGNGASKAGLTAIIEKQADGRFIAKAGVLPMCNNGNAFVDEFNLMEREDQNALQEAMENQTVTKAKAVNISFPAKCGVLGGANPVGGRYDKNRTVLDNLGISPPLLSRFDLRWCLLDNPETTQDISITKHLLNYHSNSEKVNAEVFIKKEDMIKYLNYARTLEPEFLPDTEKYFLEFISKARATNKNQDTIPIDLRIIETTLRLCYARAKLLLKPFVEIRDIQYIHSLYLKSLESFGIDTQTDSTQHKFLDSKEMNQDQTFWKIFDECKDNEGAVDIVDVIEKLACTKAFDEYKAKSYFERMIGKRRLYELKNGKWKKVD